MNPQTESPFDQLRRAVKARAAITWGSHVVREADEALTRGDYPRCGNLLDRLERSKH